MSPAARRILILMSDTGGGHRSAAEAIADALAREFPGRYDVRLVDGIARGAIFPFNHLAAWYLPAVTYAESGWGLLFHALDHPVSARFAIPLFTLIGGAGLRRVLHAQAPDLVVSMHPLLTTIARRGLRAIGSRAPFVIVVTDLFDAHIFWFDREADFCLVPTEGARVTGRRLGMPEEKMRVVGLPVSLAFLDRGLDQRSLRVKLGLAPDQRTVLLVGGGEGMGRVYEIARAIAQARLPVQLVVVAGRNRALYRKLCAMQWEIPVHVQGFVTNMPDWMRASDVLITKAGPSTISEGLACGLPILLSGCLPGQEEGNVRFVERSGFGVLRQDPEALARTLADWLAPGSDVLNRLAIKAREAAHPRAAIEVATLLDCFLSPRQSGYN